MSSSSSSTTSSQTRRVRKLSESFQKAVQKIVKSFTFAQFLDTFPLLASSLSVSTLWSMYYALLYNFVNNLQEEFRVVCAERDMINKLNAIDEGGSSLVKTADSSTKRKRALEDPLIQKKRIISNIKITQQASLESFNDELSAEIRKLQQEVERLYGEQRKDMEIVTSLYTFTESLLQKLK